jgi:hypothetical protein
MTAALCPGSSNVEGTAGTSLTNLGTMQLRPTVGVATDLIALGFVNYASATIEQLTFAGMDFTRVDRFLYGTNYRDIWTLHAPASGLEWVQARINSGNRSVRLYIAGFQGSAGIGNFQHLFFTMPNQNYLHISDTIVPQKESSLLCSRMNWVGEIYQGAWYADAGDLEYYHGIGFGVSYQDPSGNNTMGWYTNHAWGSGAQGLFQIWEMLQAPHAIPFARAV